MSHTVQDRHASTGHDRLGRALHDHWPGAVDALHHELHRVLSREDCEDAVQTAALEALTQPDAVVLNPRGWLIGAGRRNAIDLWRQGSGR